MAQPVSFQSLAGLRPKACICVGAGYSREEIKAAALRSGQGFVGEAITTVQDLCVRMVGARKESVLSALARQEVLRILLAEPRIMEKCPELRRLKRQGSFFRRLDAAIQSGRAAFAHFEEEAVYSERLAARFGENPIRNEVRAVALAYEAWMSQSELWDPPLLMRAAIEVLESNPDKPAALGAIEAVHAFSAVMPESLERRFWEALERHAQVSRTGPVWSEPEKNAGLEWSWERWHTLDDATEALAEDLASRASPGEWAEDVVLIPDSAAARRTLRRALESWGVKLADPRDPNRLRYEELVKWAMLPLQVAARNYDRAQVISWLKGFAANPEFPAWVKEINTRGVRNGLNSYGGGMLSGVHSRLSEIATAFGGRKTCEELSEAHLGWMRSEVAADSDRTWIIGFFEQLWKEFVADTRRVGHGNRKAPLLYWLERLQSRLEEMPAPVERLKPEQGIDVYRLHQAPFFGEDRPKRRVWILGMPSQWLTAEAVGDYWLSERDREVLSAEFAVRSSIQVRQERLSAIQAWLSGAEQVRVLDYQYDPDGRERETIFPILRELAAWSDTELPDEETIETGAHPRWVPSYRAFRPEQPRLAQLAALPKRPSGEAPEISATALDRYSRCGFQALAYNRWNLQDLREPDTELWPEVRGNILHEAVRLLMGSRDLDGTFAVAPMQALEMAWQTKRPKGLVRSKRIESYVKSRLLPILETFCEKEREYVRRAGTRPISLDESKFRLDYPEFSVVGTPDRIDESAEGIFILDYKSSPDFPNGAEMLESGYRLQLPFYALAARKEMGKQVLGAQFIELGKKGTRSSGIFFKPYNGKESGKLTQVRSNSRSLVGESPDETWSRFEDHLLAHGRSYVGGVFEARPKRGEKECTRCRIADLCGLRRRQNDGSEEGESDD